MDEKLRTYQKHLWQMLYTFDRFCESQGLTVFLVGGSALGAFRHNGFIPWDDDIDLAMMRPDFEKMEHLIAERGNCLGNVQYSPVENQLIPEAPVGHLYDFHVTDSIEKSPKIDIHPIDGVPEGKFQRTSQKIHALVYYLGIYHLPTKNKGKAAHVISKVLLTVIPDRAWKRILHVCKKNFTQWDVADSEYICSLFGVAGYSREVMPKKWLFPLRKCRFEEYEFWIPNRMDEYLTRLYGNWKELPARESRRPLHDSYLHCHIEEGKRRK